MIENILTKEEIEEISEASMNMSDFLDVILEYCEYNLENTKISPLVTLIETIKSENLKILDKF